MKAKITKAMRTYAAKIAFDGFERTEVEGFATEHETYTGERGGGFGEGTLSVVLKSPEVELYFRLNMAEDWKAGKKLPASVHFSGTTRFKTERGWRSFDRAGVEDSFSNPYGGSLPEPAEVVKEQLERIAKWRAADAERIDVPTIGYRIAPATRDEYAAKLKKGLPITFTPSGFGIGKRYTVKRPRHAWEPTKAPTELAAFFGVPELWLETFDHD